MAKWQAEWTMREREGAEKGWHVFDPETVDVWGVVATFPDGEDAAKNATLAGAAPEMLEALVRAVEASGFPLSGATDVRAAENGEPAWVCDARAAVAKATTIRT